MGGRLTGKVAIVTGAAGAIGTAIARAFVGEGAAVALLDRDADGLDRWQAQAPATARTARIVCDVASAASVRNAMVRAVDSLGPADVLVNNAGISITGGVEEISEADWDLTFAVNVRAAYLLAREAIPAMRRAGGGSIINVASEAAFIGFAMHPAYCASKAALVHLSRSMANAHARDRIRVNALCPGTIDTPLYRGFLAQHADPDAVHAGVVAMHPLGLGTPEDIAHAAVFLASDESRYATGAPFLIDGGATAV